MASNNLEAYIVEQLRDDLLKIVEEYVSSEDTIEKLRDSMSPLTLNFINKTINEEYFENGKLDDLIKLSIERLMPKLLKQVEDKIDTATIPFRHVEIISGNNEVKKIEGVFHKDFEDVLECVSLNIPVLLTGPAGTGKNVMLTQVAEALNLDVYRCNSPQDEYKLIGFIDASGRYQSTDFYEAFTRGGLFILDEIDNSLASALISVNDAIRNGVYSFPCGEQKVHKDFRIVATANTWGNGRSIEYVGRNKLDGATLDRYVIKEIDYDKDLEAVLYPDKEILEVFWELRESQRKNRIKAIFSMRGIEYAYEMRKKGIDLEKIVRNVIVKGLNVDDLKILLNDIDISEEDNEFYRALVDVKDSMSSK